jgi:hypothetical protein
MGAQEGVWDPIFSNFHVEPDGTFVEREFQAAKYEGHRIRQLVVMRAKTPRRAKQLGREWTLTEDELVAWNNRRVDVMLYYVDRKVNDWPYVEEALIKTGDQNIVEFNRHHDNFWGDCTCMKCYKIGQNWLGETLMLVRRRLLEGAPNYDEWTMHMLAASHAPLSRSR